MESFTIVFLTLIVIGIIILFFSFTFRNKDTGKENNISQIAIDSNQIFEQKKEALVNTIHDADDAIEQLNALTKHIFHEQEKKYEELLFLYQMIDEKKQELMDIQMNTNIKASNNALNDIGEVQTDKMVYTSQEVDNSIEINQADNIQQLKKITKKDQILKLYNDGMNITQIAKQLDIGQGEVGLILELKRKGGYDGK